MAYVKINSSQSAYSRLKYIFDGASHDGSKERVLDTTGGNIKLWSNNGKPYARQSGYYINTQFKQLRKHAYNRGKRIQAKHLIISFSQSEFDINDYVKLHDHAKQANNLIMKFMKANFPETQFVSAIQIDGMGHKFHAHVLINSISISGKCVRTNKFEVNHVRTSFNHSLEKNYKKVTGKDYKNPFKDSKPVINRPLKGWQAKLQFILRWAKEKSDSIEQYKSLIKGKGVDIKIRNKNGDFSYIFDYNGNKKNVRDFYKRVDKKTGKVKSIRGMGIDYTPRSLNDYFNSKNNRPNKLVNELNDILNNNSHLNSKKFSNAKKVKDDHIYG